jgi:flagellar motor switch protein FliN/FliY
MSDDTRKLELSELQGQQARQGPDEGGAERGPVAHAARPGALPAARPEGADLHAVYDIPVQISAVLGKATMPVSQLLRLGRGAVVALDRKVGESIDILVNNRLVARGEVVIVDEHLGVTMTEIIKSEA